jgi:hypothetical protein
MQRDVHAPLHAPRRRAAGPGRRQTRGVAPGLPHAHLQPRLRAYPPPHVPRPPAQSQQQRGVKQAAITQPEADDPVGHKYGDPPMVQSTEQTGRKWTKVEDLTPAMEGQTVRGAG